jgi:hypothetical protein
VAIRRRAQSLLPSQRLHDYWSSSQTRHRRSAAPGGERGQHDHLETENAKHGGRHNKQQKQNADKVVSTLVIVDGPFSVSGPGRFDACDRKRKQSVTHSPSRSLDLNYRVRKM